ncbi:hypothetical protein FQZ97_1068090 [compost metagenome]
MQASCTAFSSEAVGPRWPVRPNTVPCSASLISGMMLCRKAPRFFTSRFTSIRCSSLMPGISTELILVSTPRAVSISSPSIWRSCRILAAS